MSKRQIAALSAVTLVAVGVLVVVLISILSSDDGGSSPPATEAQTPARGQAGGQGGSTSTGRASPAHVDATLRKRKPAPAPDVRVPVLDRGATPGALNGKFTPAASDGTLDLNELRGTPVVLSLWSSWCACGSAMRVIQSEWERFGREGVLFLGLDVQDRDSAARRFRAKFVLTYPTASDESGEAAWQLGATGVPETFFLSADGQIVGHIVGAPSLGQMESGTLAAQAGKLFGITEGGVRLPLR
jgi:peroxiredoxin